MALGHFCAPVEPLLVAEAGYELALLAQEEAGAFLVGSLPR